MMGSIRDWYRTQPRWIHWVNALALVILPFALIDTVKKSGSELHAILWHHRHSGRITINGVTFPVYYWWAPENDYKDTFFVVDKPGPLRPTGEEERTWIEISGRPEETGTPREMIEKEIADSKKVANYDEMRTFRLEVRSQQLECLEKSSKYDMTDLSCFGDGPIYRISFIGNEESRARFDRMLAEAH